MSDTALDSKPAVSKKDADVPPRPVAPAPKAPSTSASPTKRVADLTAALDAKTQRAQELIASGKAAEMQAAEIDAMGEAIARTRGELQSSVTHLPSGHTLMMKAFAATDRATAAMTRLEAVSRSLEARAATEGSAAHGDRSEIFESAAKITPTGYCDLDTTPQKVAPCDLDRETRGRYRGRIRDVVHSAQIGWTAAINALHVDEKLKRGEIKFEQRLGQLIFGALFSVFSNAAQSLVKKGVKAGEKALTVDVGIYPGVVDAPEPDAVKLIEKGATLGAKKAASALEASMTKRITGQELADEATPSVPADRAGFLKALKSAPTVWSHNITSKLDQLFDADLAALLVGLPDSSALTQGKFEAQIKSVLQRFEEQVLAINNSVRTIHVVSARGTIRHALVMPETRPNNSLKGEWRGSRTKTGKYTFIRWIDDDMKGMAMERMMREGNVAAGATIRRANDPSYWDEASLVRLALESSSVMRGFGLGSAGSAGGPG